VTDRNGGGAEYLAVANMVWMIVTQDHVFDRHAMSLL
jgi:hypothetical protein